MGRGATATGCWLSGRGKGRSGEQRQKHFSHSSPGARQDAKRRYMRIMNAQEDERKEVGQIGQTLYVSNRRP